MFAIHQYEAATDAHLPPILKPLPYPYPPHPFGCIRTPALSTLLHASNLHRSSILYMVIYMFQCYSLKSSHPCFLAQSPRVCSLHMCLSCCLKYRIISISVRSILFLSFIVPIFAGNVLFVSPVIKEISGLTHCIIFLYFFALFT